MKLSLSIFLLAATLAAAVWLTTSASKKSENGLPETVSFNFHVRPILADRCFKCHGPDEKQRKAGLRLDTETGAFSKLEKGGFAIVAGKPEESELVRRIFLTNPDSLMPAPESHLELSFFEKKILEKWILQGAKWEKHWAFVPPVRPEIPNSEFSKKAKNEIDHFIFEKQKLHGLSSAEPTSPERLARRVSFDLTGLPPDPRFLEKYLASGETDPTENAYLELVDSLLASPNYGERWAANWLDLARYSDTHGYQDDLTRTMWPWRDWVIWAFNKNIPYDKFVTEQLAGDLLPNANLSNLVASAFNRNHKITQEGGVIDEEYRLEYVADRTNTFGKAFLGITTECARCHDHKYDPISTREYYGLSAFFNQVPEVGFVDNLKTPAPFIKITRQKWLAELPFLNLGGVLKTEKDTIFQMVMRDSVGIRKTFVHIRGQYDLPGEEVSATTISAVLPFDTSIFQKNRLGLAQWLFDKNNPLTARVFVNRLWQEVFGRGIVATSENFGIQGDLPTHPELLDWLAVEFQENGWDIKKMLRLMVTSATYRQSSAISEKMLAADPENRWLARGARHRLPFEMIRDQALAAAGLLVRKIGGLPTRPYQPPGIWEELATEKSNDGYRGEFSYKIDTVPENLYRRSIYTFNRRTIPPPTSMAFDVLPRDACEVRRGRTNSPQQALILLNDEQILEAARVLAADVLKNGNLKTAEAKTSAVFQRILLRQPEKKELKLLAELFKNRLSDFQKSPGAAEKLLHVGHFPQAENLDFSETAALMLVASAVFNLDEAVSKT